MSLRAVISEIGGKYPDINSQHLVEILDSLWPDILRSINLPLAPRKWEITREEFYRERIPLSATHSDKFSTNELYQVVAKAIRALNVADVTDPTWISPNQSDSSASSHFVADPGIFNDMVTQPPFIPIISTLSDILKEKEAEIAPTKPRSGIPRIRFKPHPRLLLTLGERIFGKFTSAIESATRDFAKEQYGIWEFTIEEISDIEESDWKRIVLSVKPPVMEHAKLMQLWDQLDNEIRTHLKQMASDKLGQDSSILTELEKNLYIELQL